MEEKSYMKTKLKILPERRMQKSSKKKEPKSPERYASLKESNVAKGKMSEKSVSCKKSLQK